MTHEMAPLCGSSGAAPKITKLWPKKCGIKPKSKTSVGSSSVPILTDTDHSTSKPNSAPAKVRVTPIPFNQYGSNLSGLEAFALCDPPPMATQAAHNSIEISSEGTPPVSPSVLKRTKLSQADRLEIGWESPDSWDFDNEMLAMKLSKLKKRQDGEVDNPPVVPVMDLFAALPASTVTRSKRSSANSTAVNTPISGTRRGLRGKGTLAEQVLDKAMKRAASKNQGTSPLLLILRFWLSRGFLIRR